jgi:hypothetical protein
MGPFPRFVVVVVALVAGTARPSSAADAPSGLAGLLLRFFSPSNPFVLEANTQPAGRGGGAGGGGSGGAGPALNHAAHFESQPNARAVLAQLNRGIASQLSTFPLGSSSAGFTYSYDESLGVYRRNTQSFGPIFAERPLTAGKGKFNFGVNYENTTYDTFEGKNLQNGGLTLYLVHQDTAGDGRFEPFFEGDIIRADVTLDLRSQTTVLHANYGVTERFDLGVAVPWLDVSLNAHIDANIERLSTVNDPNVHVFPGDLSESTFKEGGSANGMGDIVIRGKYNFLRKARSSLAGALDVRLPTGNENDLLGAGATQAKLYLVAGGSPGRFSPRASLGYTFSSGGSDFTGDLPNEINYTAGFDAVPQRRITLTADFLGRTLIDAQRLVDRTTVFRYAVRNSKTILEAPRTEAAIASGNLNLLLGSVGVKINPVGRLLIVANVLFSIGKDGLQDKITPVFGFDYSF